MLHCYAFHVLGIQISSVHFSKGPPKAPAVVNGSVTADFDGFKEIKHLLIIFSLYKNLDFYCV